MLRLKKPEHPDKKIHSVKNIPDKVRTVITYHRNYRFRNVCPNFCHRKHDRECPKVDRLEQNLIEKSIQNESNHYSFVCQLLSFELFELGGTAKMKVIGFNLQW